MNTTATETKCRPSVVLVPTKRITEAVAALCKTCGHEFHEFYVPWPMSKSVGMHAKNGMCGGRKAITLYKFEQSK